MPRTFSTTIKNTFNIRKNSDLIVAGAVIAVVLLIIIPLTPFALDILLTLSITLAMIIILITMFTLEPLQFSTFPTVLLVATLYRLALNISSTRLILTRAEAGKVINTFGQFVVSGNYVVGIIVFLIITVIQFVVITSGTTRIAEVAARFTLDAMPGKQMGVDADFNAGLINEEEARQRRRNIQQEADFYGAMDGASKFVRGDAIAGIIIILVNIIGGLIIGAVQMGMPLIEAARKFTILTVGDGLVAQIPALLISTAAGILVTRTSAKASLGYEASSQFLSFPRSFYLIAGILFVLALIPTMPHFLFLFLSGGFGYLAYNLTRKEKQKLVRQEREQTQKIKEEQRQPENVAGYFLVDPLEIEIGYNLIPLTDESQGGDLLNRLAAVRRQCATDLGIYVRPIRIRDNLQLKPDAYIFKLKGVAAASGELKPGYYLALDPTREKKQVNGILTKEPTFGLPAYWVDAAEQTRLVTQGFTVVDCATVLITHLTEFIKRHAHELLSRQDVKELCEVIKEKNPAVVEELVPNVLSLGEVQKVLQNLLKEGLPIRNLAVILEAIADGARISKDIDYLTEYVRASMGRIICKLYAAEDEKLIVITLHPRLEQIIIESLQETQMGTYPVLEPKTTQLLLEQMKKTVEKVNILGQKPVILCSARVRLPFRRLIERYWPEVAVISLNEIPPGIKVESIGTVSLDES
jgi:flagellar biosynthesis protein FlhA